MSEFESATRTSAPERSDVEVVREVGLSRLSTILCDADGNLFPSEEPAFEASTEVLNRLIAELGRPERYEADELRRTSSGKTFRALATELMEASGARLGDDALERWVSEEGHAVSAHLGQVLRPDDEVTSVLDNLGREYRLALVSSSALGRLDVCLEATRLSELLPQTVRFSAEDSLARPTSKPDPAIYLAALERLNIAANEALAIEDALSGVRSAVGADIPTIGNLCFVAPEERAGRAAELEAAGVFAIVTSWTAIGRLLNPAATLP